MGNGDFLAAMLFINMAFLACKPVVEVHGPRFEDGKFPCEIAGKEFTEGKTLCVDVWDCGSFSCGYKPMSTFCWCAEKLERPQ